MKQYKLIPSEEQLKIRAFFEKHNDKVRQKIKEAVDTEKFYIILEQLRIPQLNNGEDKQ